jgi:hypothetical protein
MSDEVLRAGRERLAEEFYDLRCELDLHELGEHMYSPERVAEMRRRVAELEPLVSSSCIRDLRLTEFAPVRPGLAFELNLVNRDRRAPPRRPVPRA